LSGPTRGLCCSGQAPRARVSPTRLQTPSRRKLGNPKKRPGNRYGEYLLRSAYRGTESSRCVDKPGLLLKSKKDQLTPAQIPYAREDGEWQGKNHNDLLSVVKEVKPHVLIGTSTVPGSFTENVVKEMAKHVERPVIFPLSNPTKLHEAKPQDLFDWTEGKALVATGSPFAPVKYEGKEYEICMLPTSRPQHRN
jgi:malic enzyme